MRPLFIIIGVNLLSSCAVTKPPLLNSQDSVRVEIVERIEKIVDTVYINIPHETTSQTINDTISHLDVEFAHSTAAITSDGLLHHSLEQKPITHPVETVVEVVVKDSIVYRNRETIKVVTQKPNAKERLKTLWRNLLTLSAILITFVFVLRTKIS